MPAGRQPHRLERRGATWPPRYNYLHLGGPVMARQPGISSIQARTPTTAARSPSLHPRRTTAQTTPEARTSDHATAASQRNGMSRDHAAARADRQAERPRSRSPSTTTLPLREEQLTRTLNSPLSVWPTYQASAARVERSEIR